MQGNNNFAGFLTATFEKANTAFADLSNAEIERVYQHSGLQAEAEPATTQVAASNESWCPWPEAPKGLTTRFWAKKKIFLALLEQPDFSGTKTLSAFQTYGIAHIVACWMQDALVKAAKANLSAEQERFCAEAEIRYQKTLRWCLPYFWFMIHFVGRCSFRDLRLKQRREWARLVTHSFWWPLKQAATESTEPPFHPLFTAETEALFEKIDPLIANNLQKTMLSYEYLAWQAVHGLCPYGLTAAFQGSGFERQRCGWPGHLFWR